MSTTKRLLAKQLATTHYVRWQCAAKKYTDVLSLTKIVIITLLIVLFGGIYVVYVTKASTNGYFYRVESQALEQIKFEHNLIKLDVMAARQTIRADTSFNTSNQAITINSADKIVQVTTREEFAKADDNVHLWQ